MVFVDTLRAKYQNDPNNVKKCHMFQVIEIVQARGISKYFLTGLKEHTVVMLTFRILNIEWWVKSNVQSLLMLNYISFWAYFLGLAL